jgi:predicted DNA-binding transcriptional regulator AlpA
MSAEPKPYGAWSYPPDYVSAETLAYRLDCSRTTIDTYVKMGLLPKPEIIGNLPRWDFSEIRAFIKARNTRGSIRGADPADDEDAHLKGIKDGAQKER